MTMGGSSGILSNHFVDFVGRAKKKRSVNAEDGHVRRNFLVLQDVQRGLREDIPR